MDTKEKNLSFLFEEMEASARNLRVFFRKKIDMYELEKGVATFPNGDTTSILNRISGKKCRVDLQLEKISKFDIIMLMSFLNNGVT
jgi:hypothetical protein